MSHSRITRRQLVVAATGTLATTSLLASGASRAEAYQGNMERALSALYDALGSLREASGNKGGHRATAMDLVQQAIGEVHAGIEYGDERTGDNG